MTANRIVINSAVPYADAIEDRIARGDWETETVVCPDAVELRFTRFVGEAGSMFERILTVEHWIARDTASWRFSWCVTRFGRDDRTNRLAEGRANTLFAAMVAAEDASARIPAPIVEASAEIEA